MPYIKQTCKAGKTKEFSFYYSTTYDKKGGSRKKKQNKTKEAQKKVNDRQAERRLTRILNANFDGSCDYITFSYAEDKRPTKEQLRKDIDHLLRDMRKLYRKEGQEMKYVWVPEIGERGATHIHITVNSIDHRKLKQLWDKGWISIKPMDDSGQYRRLANYFMKYSAKTMKTTNGLMGKRYASSKNLIIPEPEKHPIRSRNAYNHKIDIPSGWYLDKDSIKEAWHEVTGYMYFTYTLIFDGNQRKPGKELYSINVETGEIEVTENWKEKRKEDEKLHSKRRKDTNRRSDPVRNRRC